ncbi:hypothetical protein [Sporosarcina sp. E16_8]|nr:hypothetical protein [Sporosarcina sp. E16_8]
MNSRILEMKKVLEELLARVEINYNGEMNYQINEIKRALNNI